MSRSHRRDEADARESTSPQDTPARLVRRQTRRILALLQSSAIAPPSRLLELCCGRGLHALELARAGYHVTGADIRDDRAIRDHWQSLESSCANLRFLTADARHLSMRTRHDAILLLGNSICVFVGNNDAIALMRQARRLIARNGLLLMDNVCDAIWGEIAAGRYANGISEDGQWQMIWRRGRNTFALRYGPQVRRSHAVVGPGEPLYRAWSLDELDLLCRQTGWELETPECRQPFLIARPTGGK